MTMTDPIADMLARLRNANSAYHEKVAMPSSSVKARIAEILKQEGFIAGYHIENNAAGFGKTLVLDLKFGANRERLSRRFCRVLHASMANISTYGSLKVPPKIFAAPERPTSRLKS